jgi:hypothetical protein
MEALGYPSTRRYSNRTDKDVGLERRWLSASDFDLRFTAHETDYRSMTLFRNHARRAKLIMSGPETQRSG